MLEAPRGTLFHHYKVNEHDQVTMANLIVSTTQQQRADEPGGRGVADKYLSGREITEGLLNHVEVAIRAYDPCLSCATHAMGQMPLTIELLDHTGNLVDTRSKA
jgi:NAD-reducing hydrogenase large subunit